MATNLSDLAEERRDDLVKEKDAARTDLNEAQAPVSDKRKKHDELIRELASIDHSIGDTRRKAAVAHMPSDVEGLAATLRELMIQRRLKRRELLDTGEKLHELEGVRDRAQVHRDCVLARLEVAQREFDIAKQRQGRLKAWEEALKKAPFPNMKTEANKALTGPVFKAARARVKGDIPEKLQKRATQRGTRELAKVAACRVAALGAEDLRESHLEKINGPAGKVGKLRTQLSRVEQALGDYVKHSKAKFDLAMGMLAGVASAMPELTDDERGRIADAGLVAAGEAAVTAEKVRDKWRADAESFKSEIETAVMELRAADPDAVVDADEGVAALRKKLADLDVPNADGESLPKAEEAYNAVKADLETWEASIPEHIWANLVAFNQAEELLTQLKLADRAMLEAAVPAAEKELVAAMTVEHKVARIDALLKTAVEKRSGRLDFFEKNERCRVLSAVRGDD